VNGGERERGDRFEELFGAFCLDVVDYCRWRASASDGEDAVAEVFLTAWRRLGDVPRGDAARVWLYANRAPGDRETTSVDQTSCGARRASGAHGAAPRPPSDREASLVHEALRQLTRSIGKSCCSPNGRASHPRRSPVLRVCPRATVIAGRAPRLPVVSAEPPAEAEAKR
jgi:hypothetical protein